MAIVNMLPIDSGVDLPADAFPAYIKFSKDGTAGARHYVSKQTDGTYRFYIEDRGTIEFIPIKNFTIKYLGYGNTYDCEVGHVYKFFRTYNSSYSSSSRARFYFYADGSQISANYARALNSLSTIAFTYGID